MKPFNLEKAADGEPVMTKNGLPARVICVDANNPWEGIDEKICVVALVEEEGFEKVHRYNDKGEHRSVVVNRPELDLVMKTRKREGWVNVYACEDDEDRTASTIYRTMEDAKKAAVVNCVDTVKIEWEE